MLQSLELFGFKSFAERTSFEFSPGLTAVVGPNGSGKSNVVDAIKWILGDQSAKSLRGKEMTDVIFNGATGRKPANFAEATLTFDNAVGFLPTPDREVRVGRRLFRSGESEYLLNGQVVRLKDIRELFLGTGAGSSAYAIIEQGRVDQILQANAAGRRAVFEEAAGISRYKARRTEALRRLERVEQNLLRLTDIVAEVESQLNATRAQATKAAKFRDTSHELQIWWQGLAADDFRYASAERQRLDAILQERTLQFDGLSAEQTELDARLSGIDAEVAEADEVLRQAEQRAFTSREKIAGHEATVRFQATRLEELESELQRLRRQLTVLSVRAAEAVSEKTHNSGVLIASETDLAACRELLANAEVGIEQLAGQLSALREQLTGDRESHYDHLRRVSSAEQRIATLQREKQTESETVDGARKRLEELDAQVAQSDAKIADRRSDVERAESAARASRGRIADLAASREQLAKDRQHLTATLAELRETKSALTGRIAVLEDLQARGEGFGIGVREILRRARTLNDPPWNRIYGTVADLLDVDLEDAPLLEVALGDRAQLVVIEDFHTLIPYLTRSSSRIQGRVGFFSEKGLPQSVTTAADQSEFAGVRYLEANPIRHEGEESLPASPAGFNVNLNGLPGVLKRADELPRPSSRMPHLAERLLRDTWIVTSLDVALRLAAGHGRGQRFVTLSGELLDTNGTLTVGTLRADAAVVTRRSELLALRDEQVAVEQAIITNEARHATLGGSLQETTERLHAAEADARSAGDRLRRVQIECTEAERQRQALVDDRKAAAAHLSKSRSRLETLATEFASAEADRDALRQVMLSLEQTLKDGDETAAALEQKLATARQKQASARLELATTEERVSNLRNGLTRLERDLSQRSAQWSEAERRLEVCLEKRSQVTRHLLNASAMLAEAALEREAALVDLEVASRWRNQIRSRRGKLSNQEASLRSKRRTVADAKHEAELAVRELDHRLETMAARIREEYQRELPDLVTEGRSAFRLLQQEQQPAPAERQDAVPADDAGTASEQSSGDPPSGSETQLIPQAAAPGKQSAAPGEAEYEEFVRIRPEIEARVDRARRKLKAMGAVNSDSLHDLDELESRYSVLSTQLNDLMEAKRMLEEVIRRINAEGRKMFAETFVEIQKHFRELFRKLFGGGDGDIILEDPTDVLESGIDLIARPPGKELRSLSLLSGGEKAMVCVALLLAIFRSKPSPFCLLDEVDAPLDEANIGRFVTVLKEFKQSTQFIMITHRKPSMCEADVLYGVTMEQAGVSKRLNVRFDDVADDGSFKAAKQAA